MSTLEAALVFVWGIAFALITQFLWSGWMELIQF